MSDLVLSIRLTADGKGLVGEVRGSAEELKKLGQAAGQSNERARTSAEQFTAKLKDQAATLGMTRSQTLAYEAAQQDLTVAQRQGVTESIRAIDAYDRKERMLSRVRATAAAAGLIIGTVLVSGLKASVAEAANAEQAHLKLEAVLRATSNAAGLSKSRLDAEAESLKRSTGFDDDQIRNSMAVMLTFKQVQGDTFRQSMAMAADLSKLLGQDLQSSVLMLGKALEDPESGLTALRRAGVSFTDQQKFAIKSMVDMGDQSRALTTILQTMRSQGIDGIAEAMNTGLKGASNNATLAWTDLLKVVGQTAAVKTPVEGTLSSWTQYLTDMKNVIESGDWLDRLAFFSVGLVTPDVIKKRDTREYTGGREGVLAREGEQAAARESAFTAQEDARDTFMGQSAGLIPKSGEGWAKLAEHRQKLEQAAIDATQSMVRGLKDQLAELEPHATLADKVLRQLTETTIQFTPAQKAAALALAGKIDALKTAKQETEAYLLQSQSDASTQSEAETLQLRSQERVNAIAAENMTELEVLQEHLRQKQQAIELAVIYDQLSREQANRQLELLETQHQARMGNAHAQGVLARRNFEQMNARQQTQFVVGELLSMTQGVATSSRAMFNINKAAGIANAVINTYTGVTKALAAYPPPISFVMAAAQLAVGLAQVQQIRSASFGSATSAPSIGGGSAVPTMPAEGSPPTPVQAAAPVQLQEVATAQRRDINITFIGSGRYTQEEIREALLPALNEALGDGVTLNVKT